MDDYLLTVFGSGVPDFLIFVQVPHSRHAGNMVEALCYGGLGQLLGLDGNNPAIGSISVNRVCRHMKRAHFVVEVKGLMRGEKKVNDFFIYLQLPQSLYAEEAVEAAVIEQGLAFYLGIYCKKISWEAVGETGANEWEAVGEALLMS